jgi:hypothetical protein
MQLHPNYPGGSVRHSAESLSAGFVGLDFKWDVGDLLRARYDDLPQEEKVQWAFAHEMKEGDLVLVFCHHYPFALTQIKGPHNYIRIPVPEIGVWFRHFRKIDAVHYFSDYKTNVSQWKPLTMMGTLTPLRDPESGSKKLIDEWLAAIGKETREAE